MPKSSTDQAMIEAEMAGQPPHIRILDTARLLFCRDGVHATGIDAILAEAGASKMTLYARYGSKQALLRAVLLAEAADWRQNFFTRLDHDAATPAAALQAIIPAIAAWFHSGQFHGCALMNTIAEHRKTEPWLRELAGEHHRAILTRLAERAVAAGYAEPSMLARQLLLLIDGTIAALMVSGDASVLDIAGRNLHAILSTARTAHAI